MPIYVYRCEDCSHKHEALQKLHDAPLQVCPHCGHESLRKLIAPAGIIFKGSGFHKNDYSSTGRKAASEPSKPPTSNSNSEIKPAPAAKKKAGSTESKVA